jgi:hypothetical protein
MRSTTSSQNNIMGLMTSRQLTTWGVVILMCAALYNTKLQLNFPTTSQEDRSLQPFWDAAQITDSWKRELYTRLDRVRSKCGDLCKINSNEPGNYARVVENPEGNFPSYKVNVNCKTVLGMEEIDAGDTSVPYPPPEELMPFYTMGGAADVVLWKRFTNVYLGGESKTPNWTRENIEQRLELLKTFKADETYPGISKRMIEYLPKHVDLQGKSVLVIGSEKPWLEAVCLYLGATKVTTLEYGKIESGHPQIHTLTPDEFRAKAVDGTLEHFDGILSHSSLEHSGLGRYGDALNPWGDLLNVARGYCVTKPGGFLVLGVPTGKDGIEFNAHRIYGYARWPLISANWVQIDGKDHDASDFTRGSVPGEAITYFQGGDILVFRKP